jgi:hypothetical protein
MSLTHSDFREFRYNNKGEYHNNINTAQHPFAKKSVKRQTNHNKICPSCGIQRSAMNKCECNS